MDNALFQRRRRCESESHQGGIDKGVVRMEKLTTPTFYLTLRSVDYILILSFVGKSSCATRKGVEKSAPFLFVAVPIKEQESGQLLQTLQSRLLYGSVGSHITSLTHLPIRVYTMGGEIQGWRGLQCLCQASRSGRFCPAIGGAGKGLSYFWRLLNSPLALQCSGLKQHRRPALTLKISAGFPKILELLCLKAPFARNTTVSI